MAPNATDTRSFVLEGQLTGFIYKHGYQLKYLQVQVDTVEYRIKVPSDLLVTLPTRLAVGDRIRVSGWAKRKHTGILKLQADGLEMMEANSNEPRATEPASATASSQVTARSTAATSSAAISKSPAKVLVCQKSGCMKRGGYGVCAALEQGLRDRNLQHQVRIQGTGCMDRCKAGPNLVFMPDRAKYSGVTVRDIDYLIDQHLSQHVPQPQASHMQ
jgi:(2Fe-2S) ferredoxin